MSSVPTPNPDGVSAVLDPTTHEVHLYDSGELQFSLSLAEADSLADQLTTIAATSRPQNLLACPEWCTTDHAKYAAGEDDLRHHSRTIGEIPISDPDHRDRIVLVDVAVCDSMTAGTRTEPGIQLWGSGHGDELDAEHARQLADVLLRAADFLDGHWSAS